MNAQVVLDWAAMLDAGDLDGSGELVTDDIVWSNPVATVHGRDELRGLLGMFWTAMPVFKHDITDVLEQGDLVSIRGTATGVHSGPMVTPDGEIPASGNTVTFPFSAWARIEDGRIAEFRGYWDVMGFMQQIGAVPAPAAA